MKQKGAERTNATLLSETVEAGVFLWITGVLGVAVIGGIDYVSGVELRVFPLYYAPVGLVAWYRGRSGALIFSALCAIFWLGSNLLAGMRFSHVGIWVVNVLVQGTSFAIVGLLIASLRDALSRERNLSRTDPLTFLLNSRAFYEEAGRLNALCRRKNHPITVAYIDLDNFKTVNDRLGHQAGDDLLRKIAGLLRASVRPSDILARIGGDEFALLLPDVNPQEAAATLERLRFLVAETVSSSPCPITGSIGGVTFITVPEDVEHMVQHADTRMYMAKKSGKNRVHLEVAP